MLEVIMDTSIYRNNPSREKEEFNAIVRLAKSGKLRLHIPYIVQKEFVLQEFDAHEKNVQDFYSAVSKMQRRTSSDSELSIKIEKIKESFSKIQDDYLAYPEYEFSNWIKEVKGVVHRVSEAHGLQVMEDYFNGKPPFKSRKNRDDIPDAFIWQVISDLTNEYETVYAVIQDEKLREACENKKNIVTFKSLGDFIRSDVCRSILEGENVAENIKRLLKYVPLIVEFRQDNIRDQLSEILEGTSIYSETLITNSSHVAKIKNVDDFEQEIKVSDSSGAEYYGDGIIIIPIDTKVRIVAEYDLSPTEYDHLIVKRSEQILYSKPDETAEEIFIMKVTGKIAVKVNAQMILEYDLSEDDIKSLIDLSEITVDSLDQKELFDTDPIQNRWEYQYLELVRFKEENGHCEVPRKHPLGYWVSNQRQRRRVGALAKDRVERLNKIGFVWIARARDLLFDDYVQQLLEYRQLYGHINVPQQDKKYKKLGRWVNDQRTRKTRGILSKEHEDRLNKIGFVWNVLDERWNQRLSELKEFHGKFGHFDVPPHITEYPKLYSWSVKLKRKRPTLDRLAKLNTIGYDWDIESKKVEEAGWDEKLLALKEYFNINDHFNVGYKENKNLYNWLHKLSYKKPTEERLAKLRSIGFQWEPKVSSRQKPLSWDDNLNLLKTHFEAKGNFDISSTKQKRLYNWLYKIRRKRPTNDQIEKLKSIGFDWEKEKVE